MFRKKKSDNSQMGIKIHMDNQKIKHIFLTLLKCI